MSERKNHALITVEENNEYQLKGHIDKDDGVSGRFSMIMSQYNERLSLAK